MKPTSIEVETYDALRDLGIDFLPQHHLGHYVVDAFVPSLGLVIECQGDFFHSNPSVYPEGPATPIQRRTAVNDRTKKRYLANHGYRVTELWEQDIRRVGAKALLVATLEEEIAA